MPDHPALDSIARIIQPPAFFEHRGMTYPCLMADAIALRAHAHGAWVLNKTASEPPSAAQATRPGGARRPAVGARGSLIVAARRRVRARKTARLISATWPPATRRNCTTHPCTQECGRRVLRGRGMSENAADVQRSSGRCALRMQHRNIWKPMGGGPAAMTLWRREAKTQANHLPRQMSPLPLARVCSSAPHKPNARPPGAATPLRADGQRCNALGDTFRMRLSARPTSHRKRVCVCVGARSGCNGRKDEQ